MITKSTKQKMKQILQKEEKSVFLNDIKDAKKSNDQKQAEQAIKNYNSWKKSQAIVYFCLRFT